MRKTLSGQYGLFFSLIFLISLVSEAEAVPYTTNHGTQGYRNSQVAEYGRGSHARYYGRNIQPSYNYGGLPETNPWYRSNVYYGVGYPTAYDYNWRGYGGVDYQNYWASYPSTFSNWVYPSYPYDGTYYKSSNPYQQR